MCSWKVNCLLLWDFGFVHTAGKGDSVWVCFQTFWAISDSLIYLLSYWCSYKCYVTLQTFITVLSWSYAARWGSRLMPWPLHNRNRCLKICEQANKTKKKEKINCIWAINSYWIRKLPVWIQPLVSILQKSRTNSVSQKILFIRCKNLQKSANKWELSW